MSQKSAPQELPTRVTHKSDPKECPRESVPREYLDMLTSAYVPLHLHTSAHLYHTCTSTLSLLHIRPLPLSFYTSFHLHIHTVTPSHPLSPSLFLHIFSLNILICIQSLGQVDVNYRLTRNCWQIPCSRCSVEQLKSLSLKLRRAMTSGQSHVWLSGHPSSSST